MYKFENPGDITIEIYDFAMDLVATPVRNAFREGGITHSIDHWDMKNDNGRISDEYTGQADQLFLADADPGSPFFKDRMISL